MIKRASILLSFVFSALICMGAPFPLNSAFLQTDLNGNQKKITNLLELDVTTLNAGNIKISNTNIAVDLVYHAFINGTYSWPTNWISDSGHQMYILTGGLSPLVVSNNVLGAPTGTLFSVGNDFAYISVSNAPEFDTIGMNIETDDVAGGTTSHSWQAIFLISPATIFPQSGLNLTNNNNFLHVGVTFGDSSAIGILMATNFLDGPFSYGLATLPDVINNAAGRSSRHSVELRRIKADSASVVIDGITMTEFVNTNLPNWWGTNLIWEFAAAYAPEDHDSTRTRLASVYTRNAMHAQPEALLPSIITNFNKSLTFTLPFAVPISTPTTNAIALNNFIFQMAYPTNNSFNAPGYPVGSVVTTTNGEQFISQGNNNWKRVWFSSNPTNSIMPAPVSGQIIWWYSNYDGWIITPTKTNRVFQGQ